MLRSLFCVFLWMCVNLSLSIVASMLQSVAVCCSVSQCVAAICVSLSLPVFSSDLLSPSPLSLSSPSPISLHSPFPSLLPSLPFYPSVPRPLSPLAPILALSHSFLFPHLFSIFWLPPSPPSLSGSPSGAAPKILVESNLEFLREHVLALLQLLLHLARKDQVIYKYICICTYIYVCAYVLYIHNKNVHSYSTLRRVEW